MMERQIEFDCVVCGITTVDLMLGPALLDKPLEKGALHYIDEVQAIVGGITSNSGTALSRLGMRTAVLGYLGNDIWAEIIREQLSMDGIDCSGLSTHPELSTSISGIIVDHQNDHTMLCNPGASSQLNSKLIMEQIDMFARSRWALFGYYGLLLELMDDLPFVMEKIKKTGCLTAMDADNSGISMEPLARILPHLDIYFPNEIQGEKQTGESIPEKMINAYRNVGATGIIGIKLGPDGALISPQKDEVIKVKAIEPPEPLKDTLGAGDSFFGGLIAGLVRGLSIEDSGRLAAATGACNVSAVGGTAGLRSYSETATMAGISNQNTNITLSLNLSGEETALAFSQEEIENLHIPLIKEMALMQKTIGGRMIVFLAGPPGSGKTALAALWENLTKQGIIDVPLQALPMDGFHYSNDFLDQKKIIVNGRELPLRKIKGSPETFNLNEIKSRLAHVRSGKPSFWPLYDRQRHDPITDAISVIDNGIIVLEGNYLLLDEIGWRDLHRYADKLIFINGPESIMRKHVIKRHQRGGLSLDESTIRYNLVDHNNYKLVNSNIKKVNIILQIDENFNMRLVS
jgi:sugar/nucleoside kinase (ribokinase family)/pantothenate kinase